QADSGVNSADYPVHKALHGIDQFAYRSRDTVKHTGYEAGQPIPCAFNLFKNSADKTSYIAHDIGNRVIDAAENTGKSIDERGHERNDRTDDPCYKFDDRGD